MSSASSAANPDQRNILIVSKSATASIFVRAFQARGWTVSLMVSPGEDDHSLELFRYTDPERPQLIAHDYASKSLEALSLRRFSFGGRRPLHALLFLAVFDASEFAERSSDVLDEDKLSAKFTKYFEPFQLIANAFYPNLQMCGGTIVTTAACFKGEPDCRRCATMNQSFPVSPTFALSFLGVVMRQMILGLFEEKDKTRFVAVDFGHGLVEADGWDRIAGFVTLINESGHSPMDAAIPHESYLWWVGDKVSRFVREFGDGIDEKFEKMLEERGSG
ncbi:hypothetical protein QBC36DRAFT_341119, partial [Triangularia setosa]